MLCTLRKLLQMFRELIRLINQQFVSNECGEYQYINREEDTGAEGLRKAKLSYRPVFLVEKGVVKEKER